jgi:glycosyltransferase involved in cell wall biosynthesis
MTSHSGGILAYRAAQTLARPMSSVAPATPWLTVIMPVYRGEQWLESALESLATEADEGLELLVIDSSPERASAEIVSRFAGRLNLQLFENSRLPSWQTKTNFGVEFAGAEHICWLHHDDLWLPGRASEVRRWIAEAPQAALHIAPSLIIDRDGRTLGTWRCPFGIEGEISTTQFVERLLVQNFISAPAPVYRKQAWLAAGGIDESLWYTGDWDIWLKLAAQGSVHHHRQALSAFRVHGASLTVTGSGDIKDFERQMHVVLERHLPRVAAADPTKAAKVRRASLASTRFNCALAAASDGRWSELSPAVAGLLALGPGGLRRYVRDSRILDRLIPRLRAKLTGSF